MGLTVEYTDDIQEKWYSLKASLECVIRELKSLSLTQPEKDIVIGVPIKESYMLSVYMKNGISYAGFYNKTTGSLETHIDTTLLNLVTKQALNKLEIRSENIAEALAHNKDIPAVWDKLLPVWAKEIENKAINNQGYAYMPTRKHKCR